MSAFSDLTTRHGQMYKDLLGGDRIFTANAEPPSNNKDEQEDWRTLRDYLAKVLNPLAVADRCLGMPCGLRGQDILGASIGTLDNHACETALRYGNCLKQTYLPAECKNSNLVRTARDCIAVQAASSTRDDGSAVQNETATRALSVPSRRLSCSTSCDGFHFHDIHICFDPFCAEGYGCFWAFVKICAGGSIDENGYGYVWASGGLDLLIVSAEFKLTIFMDQYVTVWRCVDSYSASCSQSGCTYGYGTSCSYVSRPDVRVRLSLDANFLNQVTVEQHA